MKGQELSKTDIEAMDTQVEAHVPVVELANFPRETAIVTAFAYFEDQCRSFLSQKHGDDESSILAGMKHEQDALHFVVLWIFAHCSRRTQQYDFTEEQMVSMHDIFQRAQNYSRAWDVLAQLQRGWAKAYRQSDGSLHIETVGLSIYGIEEADILLFGPDENRVPLEQLPILQDWQRLLGESQAKPDLAGGTEVGSNGLPCYRRFNYKLPGHITREAIAQLSPRTEYLWELNGDWDLGGYKLSEFRDFWNSLIARCQLHATLCFCSGEIKVIGGGQVDLIMIKSCKTWIYELSKISGLSVDKVKAIVSDLTYVQNAGATKLDVTAQPFVPLSGDDLCISNQLVTVSNAERNLWKLLMIRKRGLIEGTKGNDGLKNRKEMLQIAGLQNFFEDSQIRVVPFATPKGQGDLEVMLVDEAGKFALGLQLKWIAAPDRINEVAVQVAEYNNGVEQARKAQAWILSSLGEVDKQLKLRSCKIDEVEFHTMVLSKNSNGGGRPFDPAYPICSEKLLKWVMGPPLNKSLRQLWQVAKEPKRYVPVPGKHYDESDVEFYLPGLIFKLLNAGVVLKSPCYPSKDINFDGL
jgi:hypothetical protein